MHRVFSWNIEVRSKISARGWDGFCFEDCMNAVKFILPENRPLQRNSNWQCELRTILLPKLKNIYFYQKSRGIIRIRMYRLIFVLSTFEMYHLDMLDPVISSPFSPDTFLIHNLSVFHLFDPNETCCTCLLHEYLQLLIIFFPRLKK